MSESAAAPAPQSPRDPAPFAFAGVVVAFAVLNALTTWISQSVTNEIAGFMMLGAAIIQPMLLGVWTALGSGSILMRATMALPCVLLVIVVPGYVPPYFSDLQRREFVTIALACIAIYVISLIVFLIFRRLTRLRLQSHVSGDSPDKPGIRFSVKFLLAVTTIYAVCLGLATRLTFQSKPPPPSFLFGPDFFIFVVWFGGAILAAAVLPTIAVPLAILHGRPTRRASIIATSIWAVVTLVLFVVLFDDGPTEAIGVPLLTQTGAILTGMITALALRYFGLRVIRFSRKEPSLTSQPDRAEN
jgi:hypothetical protein